MNKKLIVGALFMTLFLMGFVLAAPATVVARDPNFPNYSKGPRIDRIVMKYLSEADQIPALKAGDINVSAWFIHPDEVKPLATDPNIQIESNTSLGFFYLAFNLRTLPFNDSTYNGKNLGKILRQAIAHAIDKEEIARSALQGWGTPIDSVIHVGYGVWHNPNIPKYEFNLTLAAKMLDDAGIVDTDGDGIRNDPRSGANIEFDIEHPTQEYDPVRYTAGRMIADWLQQIGIGAHSAPTEFIKIVYDAFIYANFTVYILGWGIGDNIPDTLYWFFHSSMDVTVNPYGLNAPGFHNTTFDKLAESTLSEMDPQKLLQDVYEAQVILAEELPYIPLFTRDSVYAHRVETVGWVNMPEGIMGQIGAKLSMLNVHQEDKPFGGTLYWGMVSYPASINPYNPASNDVWSAYIQNQLWDGLIQLDAELDVQPWLAENWTVETETIPAGTEHVALENVFRTNTGNTTPIYVVEGGWDWEAPTEAINGTVITWYLRDGLKWSDGQPLTAYDVNFSYYLALNYDNSSWSGGAIWKIEVLNETTIRIHLAMTDPFAVRHFAITPRPMHIWAEHWDDADTWTMGFDTDNDTLIRESTVGSGPFIWGEHHAGDYIILERNPYYWNQLEEEKPTPGPIEFGGDILLYAAVAGVVVVVVVVVFFMMRKK